MSAEVVENKRFNFPLLDEVTIGNFSLYKKKDTITLPFDKNVFCLAGANGLGKSTFLTIINFGLTGVVIDPEKNYKSLVSTAKIYSVTKKFHNAYFEGRVDENDRERAYVTLQFTIGNSKYRITRSFFDSEELIAYERIVGNINSVKEELTSFEKFDSYKDDLIHDIGLATFDQFVFLQHFVFTFDEHHYLLFWDKVLMETALYLFFGVDVNVAQKANNLRKRINELGSNIRNFTYQKNRTVKEVEELKGKIEEITAKIGDNSDAIDAYEQMLTDFEEGEVKKEKLNQEFRYCDLNISDYSIKMSEARSRYQKIFDKLMSPPLNILDDKTIKGYLAELKNQICAGGSGENTFKNIKDHILKNLCSEKNSEDNGLTNELSEIDSLIEHLKTEVDEAQAKKERIDKERLELDKELLYKQSKIVEFENKQGEFIKKLRADKSGDLTGLLNSYYKQIQKMEDEIDLKREEKQEIEKEFKKLERTLNRNFAKAQEEFMPMFQGYVAEFLGLDVNTILRNTSEGTTLVLEISDSERTDIHQLSESQRYFVDIGLRMALIKYGCENSMMLVDTPEGSLDIAYESKAGKMFAEFAAKQHKLIMTANINTSQLLIELAKKCKSEMMRLERMTEWTFLSNVQQEEQSKIEAAFDVIEESLADYN